MAFTCGFFNSQNGDRKYNAEQMASIFDGLIKDGVYDTVGDIFAVTPGTGMQVRVGSGRAWFDHTWNNNDAQYPLAIAAADVSLPRYDAVFLETNHSDTVRTNRLRVLTGTPASNPAKPTMASSANVKQHPLAYIRVTAGATAITQSMIQVVVGTSECPFVTGIIETAQIDALFQQWNGEFDEWFDNLKAQLSDNVVANLQNQINQKVNKSDVATTADIEAGTSTTKWVSPKGLKDSQKNGVYDSTTGTFKKIISSELINDDKSVTLSNLSRNNIIVDDVLYHIVVEQSSTNNQYYQQPFLRGINLSNGNRVMNMQLANKSTNNIESYISMILSGNPKYLVGLKYSNSSAYSYYRFDYGKIVTTMSPVSACPTKNYTVFADTSNRRLIVFDKNNAQPYLQYSNTYTNDRIVGFDYNNDIVYVFCGNGNTFTILKCFISTKTVSTLVSLTLTGVNLNTSSNFQFFNDGTYIYFNLIYGYTGQSAMTYATKLLRIRMSDGANNRSEFLSSIYTDTTMHSNDYTMVILIGISNNRLFYGNGYSYLSYMDLSALTRNITSLSLGPGNYGGLIGNFADYGTPLVFQNEIYYKGLYIDPYTLSVTDGSYIKIDGTMQLVESIQRKTNTSNNSSVYEIPIGSLSHYYDISNEEHPIKIGHTKRRIEYIS